MLSVIRWATLIALAVFAYLLIAQSRQPERPGQGGLGAALGRFRALGRRVRLVALIYVLTIVVSAVLRVLFGWGL